jgi:hypothetical protein
MLVQVIEFEKNLLEKINLKKKRLIKFASMFELTDQRVVKCSQELDDLLNQYQKRELHLGKNINKENLI